MNNLTIPASAAGERLDNFLSTTVSDHSRNQIQKLIKDGLAGLNGQKAKPSAILKTGDTVFFELPKDSSETPLPERGDITILFENDDFMIVNKPSDLVVHPAHANKHHTLVNYLLELRPEITRAVYDPNKAISLERPGIVHRLDKDTSGLLIVAKTFESLQKFSKIIHNHKLDKTYKALVLGWPDQSGEIKTFLRRGMKDRRKMEIHHELGKEAMTTYSVDHYYLFNTHKLALVSLKPITGRTHQLRVHLKSIGHPVLGDQTYNNLNSSTLSSSLGTGRQLLHAQALKFRYNNNDFDFCGELPDDFKKTLSKLKEPDV